MDRQALCSLTSPFAKDNGMTLIELMIVLVVVGLLALLAFPAYQQQILSSRRHDAQTQLMRIKLQQEAYRLSHNSYAEQSAINLPASDYFDFSVVNASTTTYTLVAIAKGSQQQDGGCQTLALDQSMNQTPTECW